MTHNLYKRPTRPIWASQEKHGTTYNITYKPNKGLSREEVIRRFEEIVRIIRTSFTCKTLQTL